MTTKESVKNLPYFSSFICILFFLSGTHLRTKRLMLFPSLDLAHATAIPLKFAPTAPIDSLTAAHGARGRARGQVNSMRRVCLCGALEVREQGRGVLEVGLGLILGEQYPVK